MSRTAKSIDEGNRTRRTNIVTGAVTEYEWDYRNRLTKVTERPGLGQAATKEVTYSYDVFDRLVKRSVDPDGAGEQGADDEFLVYDGQNVMLKLGASGTVQERMFYGPMVDQALAQEDGAGDVRWLLGDNLGTIRHVLAYDPGTNQSAVADHLKYGAFGNIVSQTNAAEEPNSTYTGRQRDPETGLYYYRARWYDGGVGRFLSEDPLGFAAGDTNLQRYVGNNPINATDPSGMSESPGQGGTGGFRGGSESPWSPFAEREVKKVVDRMVDYLEFRAHADGQIGLANVDSFRAAARKAAEATVTWSHKRDEEALFTPYLMQVNVHGAKSVDEVRNLRDATRLAALRIERTLYVLKNRREALRSFYRNPQMPMGRMASLPDGDYENLVRNFQAAYDGVRGRCVTYIVVPTGAEKGTPFASDLETQLFTPMNRFTYNATGEMHLRQSVAAQVPDRSVTDITHELGRRYGRQFEEGTGNPRWDVRLWDQYISYISDSDTFPVLMGRRKME